MDSKEIVKGQFDLQTKSFSNWSVTKNEGYMQAYFDFIGFEEEDELLDAARGKRRVFRLLARRLRLN